MTSLELKMEVKSYVKMVKEGTCTEEEAVDKILVNFSIFLERLFDD